MASTTEKIAKNVSSTVKITGQATSTLFTIISNPYFWIFIGILFFPLIILNYLIFMVANGIIALANVLIFIIQLIIFALINLIAVMINILIQGWNNLSVTIPIPDPIGDITINLPNLPTLGYISLPTLGIIPYVTISTATLFPNKLVLLYIFELIGFSLI